MDWNKSDNYENDNDPWKNNNDFNKKKREKRSISLSNIFRKFSNKFNKNSNNKTNFLKKKYYYINLLIAIVLVVWGFSGFYTVKEAERGVILRLGKFDHLVQPGLNWKPTFIDNVITVNVESIRELASSGMMLTSDENVVRVEMNIQYRINNPERYLFSVIDANDSLSQATNSAVRGVIGKYTMDHILTEGRTVIRNNTQQILEKIIKPYDMGIELIDVNFQAARPPEEVKEAFDDAIAARENEQQYIREAEAYSNEVKPLANGQAKRILENSRSYRIRTILKAQGEIQRFIKILPEYKASPKITRERLYLDTMENILSNTYKILIDNKNNNLLLFNLNKMFNNLSVDNKKINLKNNVSDIPYLLNSKLK